MVPRPAVGTRSGGAIPRAGWRIAVPGYPQWIWRQRERALVFSVTFVAALLVGLFAWGTRTGLAMLGLAFLVHVASVTDVIRQATFPGFARGVPTLSTSFGLGLSCYLPILLVASVVAWPGERRGAPGEGYLINRWAYRTEEPRVGDWVYYRSPRGRGYGLARVVAGPGQGVEWFDDRLRVGGFELDWLPTATAQAPLDLALTVPQGQLLVAPLGSSAREHPSFGLLLLPRENVIGRAWAQSYPVWSRRLLF